MLKTNLTAPVNESVKKKATQKFNIKMKKKASPSESSVPSNEQPIVGYQRRSSPRKKSAELVAAPSPTRSAAVASVRRTSPRNKKPAEPVTAHSAPESGKLPEATANEHASAPESGELPEATAKKHASAAESGKLPKATPKTTATKKTVNAQAPSKEDVGTSEEGRKRNAKRKLDTDTGPCLNIQLKNPNDNLLDLQDNEAELYNKIMGIEGEEADNFDADKVNDKGHDVEKEGENDNGHDVEENDKNAESEVERATMVGESAKKKRKYVPRGPTQMKAMNLENKKDPTTDKAVNSVPFNTREQPIGNASITLASVLGLLVRRNISLTHRDWRVVDDVSKQNLWKVVQQRFIVPEYFKDYYIGKMGTYLKEARSRKTTAVLKVLDKLKGEEKEKMLAELRPTSMTDNQWEAFVKHVDSEKFRVHRLKMQGVRAKYKTPHTISRQGYARLEAQMQEELKTTDEIERVDLWKKGHKPRKGKVPNPGVVEALEKIEKAQAEHGASCGSSVTNDVLAKALGENEKTVRLAGLGYGATRKKVVAQSHYKKMIKECQESCNAMNARLAVLEERNSKCVCDDVTHSHRVAPSDSNNQASNSRMVPCNGRASTATPTTSPISRTNEVQVPDKHKPCKLLSWYIEGEMVADAQIFETDPAKEVHGNPIGFGAYSVFVLLAIKEDALVFKGTDEIRTVKQAQGTVVTWPKDFIVYN